MIILFKKLFKIKKAFYQSSSEMPSSSNVRTTGQRRHHHHRENTGSGQSGGSKRTKSHGQHNHQEDLEQKKRKMRQMVDIYRKPKSEPALVKLNKTRSSKSTTVTSASAGRKKCKNSDCRCRERRRKKDGQLKEDERKKKQSNGIDEKNPTENGVKLEQQQNIVEEENPTEVKQQQAIDIEGHQVEQEDDNANAILLLLDTAAKIRAEQVLNFGFQEIKAQILLDCLGGENISAAEDGQRSDQVPAVAQNSASGQQNKRMQLLLLSKVAQLDMEQLDKLTEKRAQLMKNYKLNCSTIGLVTRKLLLKDQSLQVSLRQPLLAVMRDYEEEIWMETHKFVTETLLPNNQQLAENY